MEILSWNIQAAKGVDDVISVGRIVSDIKNFSDADVICLQEVLCTPTSNQVAELASAFPEHTPVFGAAIDRLHPQGRLQFGNMILARTPVLHITQHKLPQPAEPTSKHMPRQAIEVVLDIAGKPLRVCTLHLDYFAERQRSAQVNYLIDHYIESMNRYKEPSPEGGAEQFESLSETSQSIYCGDFNLNVDSPDYDAMINASGQGLVDCWRHLYKDKPHDPTCGIYDHVQWKEGSHCRDFFFVSPDVAASVSKMDVNQETAASDHQPIKLVLS